jgi:hypothetical protein
MEYLDHRNNNNNNNNNNKILIPSLASPKSESGLISQFAAALSHSFYQGFLNMFSSLQLPNYSVFSFRTHTCYISIQSQYTYHVITFVPNSSSLELKLINLIRSSTAKTVLLCYKLEGFFKKIR